MLNKFEIHTLYMKLTVFFGNKFSEILIKTLKKCEIFVEISKIYEMFVEIFSFILI